MRQSDLIEQLVGPRVLTSYPGGKNGAGVYQRIINHMPPHEVYIEPFAGSAAVWRHKRPAPMGSILIDRDAAVIASYDGAAGTKALCGDGIAFLEDYRFTGRELVYADPPYHPDTRAKTQMYLFELPVEGHERLLKVLRALPCRVMLSGYWSESYAAALPDWHVLRYQTMTRGGLREECLWCNFALPTQALHDYRYLGEDYRQRERIKRKVTRWTKNLKAMDELEKRAVLSALLEE